MRPAIRPIILLLALTIIPASLVFAADAESRRADRAAIERVYYNHRIGQKPPFEQVMPRATLDSLVRLDLRKEAALNQIYNLEVTPAMLAAEVQRINTTTRAPEILAEIKAALGNNPTRFANAFAKPLVVERLLREKFDNDDALHAAQRLQAEQTRNALLAARKSGAMYDQLLPLLKRGRPNAVTETTWDLGKHPAGTQSLSLDELEIRQRFGANAQILPAPSAAGNRTVYFEDLPDELQKVLRVQLRGPADVSAVIETPAGFLLYVTKQRTESSLSVAALSLTKRSYEQWLDELRLDLREND